jgi:Ankyrin repeats (many copies)
MANKLLAAIYENKSDLLAAVGSLLDAGHDPDFETEYRESPLSVASNNGRFDVVRLLLDRGADKTRLQWPELFYVIAFGSVTELVDAIVENPKLDETDGWDRTPFLFSLLVGSTAKSEILLNAGAFRNVVGRCGKTPMEYAIQQDNTEMLDWLMQQGFDIEQTDDFGDTPLIAAAKLGAIECLSMLITHGADVFKVNFIPWKAIQYAANLEIVRILLEAGADINDISKERRAEMLGYQVDGEPDVTFEVYKTGKHREFGTSNPELSENPFWHAMIKCGGSAYRAANKFDAYSQDYEHRPVWTYDRFGNSITPLPDGRFIEIAGEHEDSYDPDFCIYNDVFLHSGKGNCEIYTYPREIFPPTDFHTATLVGECIYIIGNLGYKEDRKPGYTQVYRLDVNSLRVERVETIGEVPGWISRHRAVFDGKSKITISGGKRIVESDGEQEYIENVTAYSLDLETMWWQPRIVFH